MSDIRQTPNPYERSQVRCVLVERKDKPGALGVHVSGGRFVCPLPDGYDMYTSVTMHKGYILVAHPMLPALRADPNTGKVELVDPTHIRGGKGRMKLLTH